MAGYGPLAGQTLGSSLIFASRLHANGGTPLQASDFALSAGWGTTASVAVANGTDQRWRIVVTSAGTGQGATPTITLTFRDGPWPAGTRCVVVRNGGSGSTMNPSWSGQPTGTGLVITVSGTPVAAATYAYDCIMIG